MSEREDGRMKPPRLASERKLGPLLQQANAEYQQGLDEAAAYRRLAERIDAERERGSGPRRSSWRLAGALSAAVCLCALVLYRTGALAPAEPHGSVASQAEPGSALGRSVPPPATTPNPAALSGAEDAGAPTPELIAVRPSAAPTALQKGQSRFPDGSVASVAKNSVARVRSVRRTTKVVLDRGGIELVVAKQTAGSHFEVEGGAYRFEVLGTVFRVEYERGQVSLEVREGSVAVWQGQRLVKRVAAGEFWKSESEAGEPRGASLKPAASEEPAPDCLGFAREGEAAQAERCFGERAAGSGLAAEMALYELARLRRDVLGNANGALAALGEYAERFPRGSLRHEVDVFRVELLAHLGRAAEALKYSEALLASEAGRERAAELRLLRGNVYRQALGDSGSAEREYAAAEAFGGAAGAQATYLRAQCFDALGDYAGARAAYERYLSVPGRPLREPAQRRLAQLGTLSRPKEPPP